MTIIDTIRTNLETIPPVPTLMPHCADMLLSLVGLNPAAPPADKPDSLRMFEGYFRFAHAPVFPPGKFDFRTPPNQLHPDLLNCLSPYDNNPQGGPILKAKGDAMATTGGYGACFPSKHCRPSPCLSLAGNRHGGERFALQRLLIADAVWLFYMERMGTFQILGALLDDYASQGKLPISSHTLPAFVMEEMIASIQQGSGSQQSHRARAVRRSVGWTTPGWRERNYESSVNNSFSQLLHKLIPSVLAFYRDKRLAVAIQGASAGTPSMATITEIGETIKLLKLSFAPFDYGRVYSDVLSGIVWIIATHALVDELRDDIGIPRDFTRPDQFIPAAYDMLVSKQPMTNTDVNRYTVHRTLADQGRRIVLDVQGLPSDPSPPQLQEWLNDPFTEATFEAYRAAYRNVTGTDLGTAPAGAPIIIEQAA
jgi:hypothetical protein